MVLGVLMPLSKPGDWTSTIRSVAQEFQNGEVVWFTDAVTPYDGTDGTGGSAGESEIVTTTARIQHLREPRTIGSQYDVTVQRRFRVQIPYSAATEPIGKGVKGRITNGGENPGLVGKILVVDSAVNASWMAVRSIEAVLEGDG